MRRLESIASICRRSRRAFTKTRKKYDPKYAAEWRDRWQESEIRRQGWILVDPCTGEIVKTNGIYIPKVVRRVVAFHGYPQSSSTSTAAQTTCGTERTGHAMDSAWRRNHGARVRSRWQWRRIGRDARGATDLLHDRATQDF